MNCIFHLIGLRMSTKFLRFCWWIILKDIYHLFLFEIKSNQRVSVNDVSTFFTVPCYIEQPQLCREGFASSFLFSSFFCVRQVFFQLQPSQGLCLISSSHQLKSAVVLVVLPHSCVVHHPFYGLINNFRVHSKILIKFLSSSYQVLTQVLTEVLSQVLVKFLSSSYQVLFQALPQVPTQILVKFLSSSSSGLNWPYSLFLIVRRTAPAIAIYFPYLRLNASAKIPSALLTLKFSFKSYRTFPSSTGRKRADALHESWRNVS